MWNVFLISTIFIIGVLTTTARASPDITKDGFQDCIEKDSISCIQIQIFRKAREFFSQDKINILGGISLTKEETTSDRGAKSSDNLLIDQHIEKASDVEDREVALESYLWNKATNFFTERSITWNPSQTARSLVDSIPETVKEDFTNMITEGRGKKKQLKQLLPFLIGFKLKMVGLLILAYFVIALIAKKAILASLVSLAISGFIALKKLLAKHEPHHESWGGHGGWGHSAPAPVSAGWGHEEYGGYGSHSQPVAQQIAYNGQKHK